MVQSVEGIVEHVYSVFHVDPSDIGANCLNAIAEKKIPFAIIFVKSKLNTFCATKQRQSK